MKTEDIGYIVFLLPTGRWPAVIGRKKIFLTGLIIFTVASGLAPTGTLLLLFRFIQGAGVALSQATAMPIIVAAFPS